MSLQFIKRVRNRPPEVPFLDTRDWDVYQSGHFVGASSVPAAELGARSAELPPKGSLMYCITEADTFSLVSSSLEKLGYTNCETVVSSTEFWEMANSFGLVQSGTQSARMWRPNAFLQQCLPLIERRLMSKTRNALDLACGSGRDAVFLSECGWRVTAVDYQPKLLVKCRQFAESAQTVPPTLVELDIEAVHRTTPLAEKLGTFDLIHVSRYLHRPLLPSLASILNPGGFIVYSTFMSGCEIFGKPRHHKHILEPGELKKVFSDFVIFDYREARIEDLRPLQYLCAQKLPSGVCYNDIVHQALQRPARPKTAKAAAAPSAAASDAAAEPSDATAADEVDDDDDQEELDDDNE